MGLVAGLLSGCAAGLSSQRLASDSNVADPATKPALAFQANDQFGSGLSRTERGRLSAAEAQALEFGRPGEPIAWGGDSDGASGTVSVTQPFRVGQSNCRRFSHLLTVKSKSQEWNGTACRRQGENWRLVQ